MIITLVSKNNRIGKTALAVRAKNELGIKYRQFTGPLKAATVMFVEMALDKDSIHPELGVTNRQIGDAISAALIELHPTLPVYMARAGIEELARKGYDIIIDDCRRLSEFVWLDKLAADTGTVHEVIEIIPFPDAASFPMTLKEDTWTNGVEPCGRDAWPSERYILINDGTDKLYKDGVHLIGRLIDEENERYAGNATA